MLHAHQLRVVQRPDASRPAKVITLESRRKARLERIAARRQSPQSAA